jgi:hypothetical protein
MPRGTFERWLVLPHRAQRQGFKAPPDIKVFRGTNKGILRPFTGGAHRIHGADGLDGVQGLPGFVDLASQALLIRTDLTPLTCSLVSADQRASKPCCRPVDSFWKRTRR